MCANVAFRALYVPAMIFPEIKWLGLPPVLLGFVQGVGHVFLMPRLAKAKFTARLPRTGLGPLSVPGGQGVAGSNPAVPTQRKAR
jgi:hypothetical protein